MTAEIVAALHVHLSNLDLHQAATALQEAGYLTVPNGRIIPALLSIKTALYGGIFYTLSIGAALTTVTLVLAWGWDRFFHRDRRALLSPLILWAGCLILANRQGVSPLATAHFLFTPPVVFLLAARLMPRYPVAADNREWLIHPVALVLLALLGASQMEAEVFSRFRDRCLLNNPAGRAVNDFYYRYTLYAARSFKSMDQRLLTPCRVEAESPVLSRRIASRLARYDYLAVGPEAATDLVIDARENPILVHYTGHPILRVTRDRFFHETRELLKSVSRKTDRYGFLRWVTFLSLIGESLILLYLFISLPFQILFRLFLSPFKAKTLAALICLMICWAFFQYLQPRPVTDIGGALRSDNWQQQIAALKTIEERKLEIAEYPVYTRLLESPHVAVRVRLARALGVSRAPATYPDLLSLLNDDHVTVVYQTYWGLGRRGRQAAIPRIEDGIRTSDHWYVQTYAYNALRRLGWKQTVSD